jgi:GWxTD domain-containing protein
MYLSYIDKVFNVQWQIVPETGLKEKLKSGKVPLSSEFFKRSEKGLELILPITKPKGLAAGVLIIELIDVSTAVKYTSDILLDFTGLKINSKYTFFKDQSADFPYFKNYINVGQTLTLKSFFANADSLFLVQQTNNSTAALSPMSTSKKDENNEFKKIKTISIKPNEAITFDTPGTFYISESSVYSNNVMGFVVNNSRFPNLTEAALLLEPLVYMSTPKEIETLRSTSEPKKALDLYFLNLAKGDQKIAKSIISSYYNRVSQANNLFSTYKEGWKTDKGMVFIIMGPPSRVQKNRQKEIWQYTQNQNNSDIIFTFQKKNNKYITDHYELVRYPEYASFWYPYVELWRKGSILE